MVQRVLSLGTATSHAGVLDLALATPVLIQLPASASWEAAGDGSSV